MQGTTVKHIGLYIMKHLGFNLQVVLFWAVGLSDTSPSYPFLGITSTWVSSINSSFQVLNSNPGQNICLYGPRPVTKDITTNRYTDIFAT